MADFASNRRVVVPLIVGPLAIWLAFRQSQFPYLVSQWLGLALAIIGLSGVVVARWTLGSSFSVTPQARQLVTRGIYSKIRNPIYVSGMVFLAGLILIIRMPWLWAALGVLLVVQIFRAHKEAQVLEAKFGEEYRSYRERTWF